jgi:tetratricopeptide (TPR) repeat protein
MLGRRGAAEGVLDAMLARWPGDAWALASRAHVRAQCGRIDQALEDQQRLLQGHAQRGAADWFNLAFLLEQADRPEQAEPAFRRATELDPALDRAWYGLALVLIRLQRLDEAVSALRRNTQLQPMSPFGWYQLARLQAERDQPDEALTIIRHLMAFEPRVADQLVRETGLTP